MSSLGLVVLVEGLVEARAVTLAGLVGAKVGAGAMARAAGVASNLTGGHSSTLCSLAFPNAALPFREGYWQLSLFLSVFLLMQHAASLLARQVPGDRARDEGEQHWLSSEPGESQKKVGVGVPGKVGKDLHGCQR